MSMNYKDIKEFNQRCEEHPDHQSGMISYGMISQRLQEEIDELREYIEQRTWVGLSVEEFKFIASKYLLSREVGLEYFQEEIEAKLKEKNT